MSNADHPTLTEFRASVVLHAAADIIETRGWCQNNYIGPDGQVCLIEAMDEATELLCGEDTAMATATWVAARYAAENIVDTKALTDWNDTIGREVTEVTGALRQAADSLAAPRAEVVFEGVSA